MRWRSAEEVAVRQRAWSARPGQRHLGRTQTVARLVWVPCPLPRGYEDVDDADDDI